jgi:streptogramin lyase
MGTNVNRRRAPRWRGFFLALLIGALVALGAAPAGVGAAEVAAAAATPTVYQLPQATHAYDLAFAPDGTLWLLGDHGSEFPGGERSFVGTWNPTVGLTEFALPENRTVTGGAAVGPEGEYWLPGRYFDRGQRKSFGRLSHISTAGQLQEYTFGDRFDAVRAVVPTAEGVWFAAARPTPYGGRTTIARLDPAGEIVGRGYHLRSGCRVNAMAAAPGGVWFAESCWGDPAARKGHRASIARIDAAGKLTRHPVSARFVPLSLAAAGNGSSVWFGERSIDEGGDARIGRVTTSGRVVESSVPSAYYPATITVGGEGRLWFRALTPGGWQGQALASIGTDGKVSKPVCLEPKCGLAAYGLTTGPEGGIWFSAGERRSAFGGGGTGLAEGVWVANEAGALGRLVP